MKLDKDFYGRYNNEVKYMKKALIMTWEKYQDHEVIYPYYRVQESGYEVDIMSNKVGMIYGILGTYNECTKSVFDLNEEEKFNQYLEEYDLLIIPGGVKSLEKLRQEQSALDFIKEWDSRGKTIGSICHGGQMLISSKIVKGRDVSGYYSIKDDLINAGGNFVDAESVVDGNLICCPHYKWMGQWMNKVIEINNAI
jgi:protease I